MPTNLFKEYVKQAHFCLTLSKRMIDTICALDAGIEVHGYSHMISTISALTTRGLVEHNCETYTPELTTAGKCIARLLEEAEMYTTSPDTNSVIAAHMEYMDKVGGRKDAEMAV